MGRLRTSGTGSVAVSNEPVPAYVPALVVDAQGLRDRLVDSMFATKAIRAGSTYEQAESLLRHHPAWPAVTEGVRKECVNVFVTQLDAAKKRKIKVKKVQKKQAKEAELKRKIMNGK